MIEFIGPFVTKSTGAHGNFDTTPLAQIDRPIHLRPMVIGGTIVTA
jgi:hypothetical protein